MSVAATRMYEDPRSREVGQDFVQAACEDVGCLGPGPGTSINPMILGQLVKLL